MACVEIPELDPVVTQAKFSGGQVLLLQYVNHRLFIYLSSSEFLTFLIFFLFLPFSRVFVPGKEEGVRHHSHFPPHCFEENVKKERKRKHYYSQFILGKLRTPAGPQTFVVEFSSFLFFVFSWVFFSFKRSRSSAQEVAEQQERIYLITNLSPWLKNPDFSLVCSELSP